MKTKYYYNHSKKKNYFYYDYINFKIINNFKTTPLLLYIFETLLKNNHLLLIFTLLKILSVDFYKYLFLNGYSFKEINMKSVE
jgi:hypothetical protein